MKLAMSEKYARSINPNARPFRTLGRQIEAEDPALDPHRRALIHCFAAQNNWSFSDRPFSLTSLAMRKDRDDLGSIGAIFGEVGDHPAWFRETTKPYRPIAYAVQPYDHRSYDEDVHDIQRRFDLVVHRPGKATVSFWYPGRCFLFIFTRRGTPVEWLPEQR